jgi:hypothetical protein
MSAFHIQKTPVDVEVWTTDGDVSGVLQLAPFAKLHSGAETVLDVMNGTEAFLPIISDGRVQLLAKSCILAIRYRQNVEPLPGIVLVEHRVQVQLERHAPFVVLLREERPPDKERVSDFLNDSAAYIVTIDGDSQVLIVKQHLVRVVPGVDHVLPAGGAKKKAPAKAARAKGKAKAGRVKRAR